MYPEIDNTTLIEEIELERFKFAAQSVLNRHFAIEADCHIEYFADRTAYTITQGILGEELEGIYIRYPSNWWQAFKERWFRPFILRRFPVLYTVKEYSIRAYYPKVALPKENHVVRLAKLKDIEWSQNAH